VLILRPTSWLALLSRTFTFELALAGLPQANVEYNYVGKQSIPTTGLSPASLTALWAAVPDLTPRPDLTPCDEHDVKLLQAGVGCQNTLYNAVLQTAAEFLPRLRKHGARSLRIELLKDRFDRRVLTFRAES
jgi:hypothetical protein